MLSDIQNSFLLERLQKARARTKMQKVFWPDRHLVGRDGQPVPFHEAQAIAYDSPRRTVAVIGGSQVGKTTFSPWWLRQEIIKHGSGDYLAVTSSYDLFRLRFLPSLLNVYESILKIGRFWAGDKILELADPLTGRFLAVRSTDPMWARIILRSAQSLSGLESATAKGAILDEAGQEEFPIEAYRAIQRRLALNRGRQLLTTTLYNIGWIKSEILDKALIGGTVVSFETPRGAEVEHIDNAKTDITVIHADSIVNPEFSTDEYENARSTLPPDVFSMFYRGRFSRPRHMVYDCFDESVHCLPRFTIPNEWRRSCGLDFGALHTVAVFCAEEPETGNLYFYKEYEGRNKTAKKHVEDMLRDERERPMTYGGANAEGQWRQEFRDGGLSVRIPRVTDYWVGINKCYGVISHRQIFIFDDLEKLKSDILSIHRKTDALGNPTDEISQKNIWHYADAFRYVVSSVKKDRHVTVAVA